MTVRVRHRGRVRRAVALAECCLLESASIRVDRDAGVIFGVKVLGKKSRNGREYTEACLKDAADRGLYEGASVYFDHARDRQGRPALAEPRTFDDRLGTLRNVRFDGDCLRGDLHYLKSHEYAERVCEAAERGNEIGRLGLSHRATGDEVDYPRAGGCIVNRLAEVHGVDVVDDPATADSFVEQTRRATMKSPTIKAFLEAWAKKSTKVKPDRLKAFLEAAGAYCDKPMVEDDEVPPAMPGDEPPADMAAPDPDEALWSGFSAAIQAVLDGYKAGDMEMGDAVKKVAQLIKAHAKLTAEPGAAEEPAAEQDEGDDDKKKDKDKDAAEQVEFSRLKSEKTARLFCEQHGYQPASEREVEHLARCGSDDDRLDLLETFRAAGKGREGKKARSGFVPKDATVDAAAKAITPAPAGGPELAKWFRETAKN